MFCVPEFFPVGNPVEQLLDRSAANSDWRQADLVTLRQTAGSWVFPSLPQFFRGLPLFFPSWGPAPSRLYSLMCWRVLARNRQKPFADSERSLPHRESAWRQPRFSRADAPLSGFRAKGSCAPSGRKQFCPARRLLFSWHTHSALLRHFHSCGANRRRPRGDFQRLGHAEAKRRARPGTRCAEESPPEGYFPQRVLSPNSAAYGG